MAALDVLKRQQKIFVVIAVLVILPRYVFSRREHCPKGLPHTSSMEVFNDRCYQFVSEERFWTDARDYCIQYGGRLVKINDPSTNTFVVNALNRLWWSNNGVWIGLHDRNSELSWQWIGQTKHLNEPATWFNWGSGHPSGFMHGVRDCVRMARGDGKWLWHETPCKLLNWKYRFICEYSLPPTSPTIPPSTRTTTRTTTRITTPSTTTTTHSTPLIIAGINSVSGSTYKIQLLEHKKHNIEIASGIAEMPSASAVKLDDDKVATSQTKAGLVVAVVGSVVSVIIIIIFLITRRYRRSKLVYVTDVDSESTLTAKVDADCINSETVGTLSRAEANIYKEPVSTEVSTRQLTQRSGDSAVKQVGVYCPMDGVQEVSRLAMSSYAGGYLAMSQPPAYGKNSPEYTNSNADLLIGDEPETDYDVPRATNYDVPRPMNIYSEIPDADNKQEEEDSNDKTDENIYESLDQYVR